MKIAPIVLSLTGCLVLIPPGLATERIALSPNEKVAGISQSEWSAAWWQWAGSFDRKESPIADSSGERCQLSQTGPVWFLAGTYGTKRTIRTCKVPHNKYLFFPLINYVSMPNAGKDCNCTCDMVKAYAKSLTDNPAMLILEVDGHRVENLEAYRQATKKCFDMGAKTPEKYKIFPSAADGYYVMLPPLNPGKHVLNFGGALPSMFQAVTYTLEVE
ncbi:hypothetical protein [Undibacterium sp.]|uniref:hypothetical protein n=1 Tax=Undibacterium sp. TaxID=1914977 RepID=UPI002C785656|nr:hypothetical protein [Undibacterium sp.]HTD04008.1 hypothetical protein [Undibacterium sp.]